MLTIYLLFFAALFILVELNLLKFRTWFYFMNFGWGRGIFHFFIGVVLVGSGKKISVADILIGIWFLLMGLIFCLLSCVYRRAEPDYVNDLMEKVNSG